MQEKKTNHAAIIGIIIAVIVIITGLIVLSLVYKAFTKRIERNARRRADMSHILMAFNDYWKNNSDYPQTNEDLNNIFAKKYISQSTFLDPDGKNYHFSGPYLWNNEEPKDYIPKEDSHKISVNYYAKCSYSKTKPITKTNDKYNIAILYALEDDSIYCGDNQ